MQPTRQTWTVVATAAVLIGLTLLTTSLVPTVGAVTILAWLLAVQVGAVRSFRTTAETATVRVEPETTYARAGTAVSIIVTAERPEAAAGTSVTVAWPAVPAADPIPQSERQFVLEPGETDTSTMFEIRIPVAGHFTLPTPVWSVTDPHGAFTESYTHGPTPEIRLVESVSRKHHIGGGGVRTSLFGEHIAKHTGSGIIPEQIRPYVQTDPANWIDWKATARLNEPHVREFDTESEHKIKIVLDHRAKMELGEAGATMLDYIRDVALGFVTAAESSKDPVCLVTAGDGGLTNTIQVTHRSTGYAEIRSRLLALEPTPAEGSSSTVELDHPESARRLLLDLEENDEFCLVLREFATSAVSYVDQSDGRPLTRATRYHRLTTTTAQLAVILTDDTDRTELWDAVRTASQSEGSVVVFLTPRVLFEPDGTADANQSYQRYMEFERYRRRLDRLDSVTAFEVAPAGRFKAVSELSRKSAIGSSDRSEDHTKNENESMKTLTSGESSDV